MANLPHLLFHNQKQDEISNFKFYNRNPGEKDDDNSKPIDKTGLRNKFQAYLNTFNQQRQKRQAEKNPEIAPPENIEYIEFEFFGPFDSAGYENYYRRYFGISPIKFWHWNTKALFTIVDEDQFYEYFIPSLQAFIRGQNTEGKITYIKEFEFLTTEKILEGYRADLPIVYFTLNEDLEIFQGPVLGQKQSLKTFLKERGINFTENSITKTIEVRNVGQAPIEEIARNFDIVYNITACSAGIIGPSEYGLPQRSFPFSITRPDYEIPTIGVIDSGVSGQTPLSTILLNKDATFSATGSHPLVDGADHGTGVAAFAALGDRIATKVEGELTPDANILSIKVLDANQGDLLNHEVKELIKKAVDAGIKLFVLTICYQTPLKDDESVSAYAYMLDKLAFDLDILVFVAVGNTEVTEAISQAYPGHLREEFTNIKPPGESMNNLSIGAIGENFMEETENTIVPNSLPALYSRKHHLQYAEISNKNKRLLKPDLLYHGGNFESEPILGVTNEGTSGMQYLSAEEGEYFWRSAGTSFSSPLAANMASKILVKYPGLKLSTVKALIVNSADPIRLSEDFDQFDPFEKRSIVGNGKPDIQKCLYSSKNEVSFILESNIEPNNLNTYQLQLPQYFNDLNKEPGVIAIDATLCFPFDPIPENFLAYCPVHMGFGFFKNAQIVDDNGQMLKSEKIKIRESWSQDGWGKKKLFSNCQKVRWTFSKSNIVDENNAFKLAVNCRLHSILSQTQKDHYNTAHPFSLVIRVTDQATNHHENSLYDELHAINRLEALNQADIDIEGEAEAEL